MRIGIIGCGSICDIYLKNCTQTFDILEVAACADIVPEKAKLKAAEYHVPKACSVEELLADKEIDIVLNITVPSVHAEISIRALQAGKHVYLEKPLATDMVDGKKILELAAQKGLLVGCAPDTFLGAGLQTSRKLMDEGWIGRPIAASAFMMGHGPESWHPHPDFFYKNGGGPMFDLGPYYLTALVALLGPVLSVSGSAGISFPERVITSSERYGEKIKVETPTHITGLIEFGNGVIGTMTTSFDVWASQLPKIEIYGTEGTLSVPDPDTFNGPVYIKRMNQENWMEIPSSHGFAANNRGIGLADMAHALISKRKHRASGELAFHVLEVMSGFFISSASKKRYEIRSTVERPQVMPMVSLKNRLDK